MSGLMKFRNLTFKNKAAAIEVLILLHIYSLFLFILPFKTLTKKIGKKDCVVSFKEDINKKRHAYLLFRFFNSIHQYWPYKFKCLTKTLAAARFLRKRKVPYTLYLGINKNSGNLKAHSWVISYNIPVTKEIQNGFEVVSQFGFTI